MKKLYILFIALFALFSCDPMSNINDEIDNETPLPAATFDYELTGNNYTAICMAALKDATSRQDSIMAISIKNKNALPVGYAAKYVPAIVKALHPNLNKGSACNVTYNVQEDMPAYMGEYELATEYKVSSSDYESIGGIVATNKCFYPSFPLSKFANNILTASYPAAVKNDIVLAIYKYADTEGSLSYNAGVYYLYNGSKWEEVTKTYYLSGKDYDAMGNPGPGKYDNFDSNMKPEDYLPTFMAISFPYAKEGATKVMVYNYYASGATKKRADEYVLSNGIWSKENYAITQTDQFIRTEEDWFFDPTVKFTMVKDDYQIIVNAVIADPEKSKYVDRGTAEYYYGSSAYYGNFDLRIIKRITGDYEQAAFTSLPSLLEQVALTHKRLEECIGILLKRKFPNAVSQSNGIDVFYEVKVTSYEDDLSTKVYVVKYQCTKSGPNAEFTFVERK